MYKFATVAEMKPVFVGGKGIKVLAEGILFAVCCFHFSGSYLKQLEEF